MNKVLGKLPKALKKLLAKKSQGDHARLGASGTERWMNCPSAPIMEDHYENFSTPYSEEGTLAHALAERALRTGTDASEYLYYDQTDFDQLEVLKNPWDKNEQTGSS